MELDRDFEEKLAAAVLPDEEQTRALGERLKAIAEDNWRAYMAANGYDLEHVVRDAEVLDVEAGDRRSSVRVEWPFSALFEFGVDPHVIEASGASVLAFEWPEMEGEEFGNTGRNFEEVFAETWPTVFFPAVNWGSESGGIPASRAVRDALMEFRQDMRG